MSGVVGFDLFSSIIGSGTSGFTTEGGVYETFINNTGTSVKGTIVVTSTSVANGVDIAPISSTMPIGAIYENGVANGLPVKVVIYGKAQVLLENGQASSLGYWCGVSNAVAGRMFQDVTPPVAFHSQEIGHSLQAKTEGTNVLSIVQMHFN